MPRKTREWNKKFLDYMEFISSHPNYTGMPHLRKPDELKKLCLLLPERICEGVRIFTAPKIYFLKKR